VRGRVQTDSTQYLEVEIQKDIYQSGNLREIPQFKKVIPVWEEILSWEILFRNGASDQIERPEEGRVDL